MTRRVAVIGAGTIGASWAAIFLARGFAVGRQRSRRRNGESFARRFIDNAWPTLEKLGWVAAGAERRSLQLPRDAGGGGRGRRIRAGERAGTRGRQDRAVRRRSTPRCRRTAVIASSSSGLLISRVTAKCKHPERCVIGHPFNPPHLIPLVEVVGGDKTSPQAIATAMEFYRAIGKHPIHIKKEVKGHVANRLQAALWREAIHLVAEGVVSVADADAAIAYGPGLRWALMGPHLTFHLAGGEGGMAHFMSHLAPAGAELDGRSRHDAADAARCRRRSSTASPPRRARAASPTCSAGATAS